MKTILSLILLSLGAICFAQKSDFNSLCKVSLKKNKHQTCEKLTQLIFKEKTPITTFSPTGIGLKSLDIDKNIIYLAFNDPNYLSGFAYCYFVYRNWIDMNKVSPDDLGLHSSGFSILNEKIEDYTRWLSVNKIGKTCEKRVQSVSGVPIVDLRDSFSGKTKGLIAINPFSSIRSSRGDYNESLKNIKVTVNHERIHVFQSMYPRFDEWSKEQWGKLDQKKKEEYMRKYPQYNWNDLKVAGREYIGYLYEEKLDELEDKLKIFSK